MKRFRATYIAIAILVLAFAWSLAKQLQRSQRHAGDEATLRIAHTLLDDRARQAFEAVAADFERLKAAQGKSISVSIMDIPERIYPQWVRTQLSGGSAPTLVAYSADAFTDDVMVARFLQPLGEAVNVVNEFNAGTPLEGRLWKDTFFDGLNVAGFNFRLSEHYGIPTSLSTTRLFINRQLLREVASDPILVKRIEAGQLGFQELEQLCQDALAHAAATGEALVPISLAGAQSRQLYQRLIGSQTQALIFKWDELRDYRLANGPTLVSLIKGEKRFDHPLFLEGLALFQDFIPYLQSGYMQTRQEDATFFFSQGNALMYCGSATDFPSLRQLIGDRFEMAIAPLPTPSGDHPRFGHNVIGPISEANENPTGVFSVVRYRPPEERELALEFLRYLTSYRGNVTFSSIAKLLPAIIEAPVSEELLPFYPRDQGYPAGPTPDFNQFDLRASFETRFHLLGDPETDVASFMNALIPELRAKLPRIAASFSNNHANNLQKQDSVIAANFWLSRHAEKPDDRDFAQGRLGLVVDSQSANETLNVEYPQRALETLNP